MKNIFKSKRNILIMMFALVVIMGIGFAAYSQQLRINDTSSIDSNWNVYIKEVSVPSKTNGATGSGTVDEVEKLKAELTTDLKYPGDYVIYNITVANDGTIDAILEKINFSMEKEDTVINYYYSVDDQTTWNKVTKNGENPYNEDLLANTTDEFQVKVEYDPTKTGTATDNQKSNKLTLNLDYAQKTGGSVVPSKPITIDELKAKLVVSGDGLYEDGYESTAYSKRYVYKGGNPDNYISFNNELWRIISIEKDDSLKIIKKDSIGNKPWDTSGSDIWDKPAALNTYLNDETSSAESYYNNLLSTDSKALIQKHNWGIGKVTNMNTNLITQIQNENGTIWNGNIGLISVSDYLRANTNKEQCGNLSLNNSNATTCRSTNYLAPSRNCWTISPAAGYGIGILYISLMGGIDSNSPAINTALFPSVYLIPDITLSGTGTMDDPFTINS